MARFRRSRFRRASRMRGVSRFRRRGMRTYGRSTRSRIFRRNPPVPITKEVTAVTDGTIDSAGVVTLIHGAVSQVQRWVRYMNWRCVLTNAGATTQVPAIRVILFADKRADGTTPAVTEVLQTASILSPLSENNVGRFIILSDRTFTIPSGANVADAAGTGVPVANKRFYKVYRRLNMMQRNDDLNMLFCLYISDLDEVGSIDAQCRLGVQNSIAN